MHGFVANPDYDWFTPLRAIDSPIDEVNFWKPAPAQASSRARRASRRALFVTPC
jgi:hypothetical protein